METMLSLAMAVLMNHSSEPLQTPSMEPVCAMMQQAVENGIFPGGVLLIRYRGEVIFREAFGSASLIPERTPMTVETLFDVASLTKVVVTTTAVMLLREQGKIGLDDRLVDWIPECAGDGKERIAIKHLLTHSSGLAPAVRPKELVPDPSAVDLTQTRRRILEEVYRLPLAYPTGTEARYSDPGFILLGEIVERASGERFDQFCRRTIFLPLGMCTTWFNPLGEVSPDQCAATEDCPWRGRVIRGEVHDETAYLMGGVAGHAGLFSTVDDLGRFVGEMLSIYTESGGVGEQQSGRVEEWKSGRTQEEKNKQIFHSSIPPFLHSGGQGRRGKGEWGSGRTGRFLRPVTVRAWTVRAGIVEGSSRAFGWDTPSEGASSGTRLSSQAFGHTGFTGTSIWIDPSMDLGVILLTNRVHPSRENVGILTFRPALHDLIVATLQR